MILNSIFCIALTLYHEARGESLTGQMAVAQVIINRVKSDEYPNTACQVVTQRDQFQWHWDDIPDWPPEDKKAWNRVWIVAEIAPLWKDVTNGSKWYHSLKVSPEWATPEFKQIGNHRFYNAIYEKR